MQVAFSDDQKHMGIIRCSQN